MKTHSKTSVKKNIKARALGLGLVMPLLLSPLPTPIMTAAVAQNIIPLSRVNISFHDKKTNKAKVALSVEYATNDQTRDNGLMFRTSLPDHGGMLFLFDEQQVVSFWMKNTILPLDLIFIDQDGFVKHIVRRATPYSEESISSRYPVKWVLEVLAGQANQYGIAVGDRMVIAR